MIVTPKWATPPCLSPQVKRSIRIDTWLAEAERIGNWYSPGTRYRMAVEFVDQRGWITPSERFLRQQRAFQQSMADFSRSISEVAEAFSRLGRQYRR